MSPRGPARKTGGQRPGGAGAARREQQSRADKAPPPAGVAARRLAAEALVRIDREGAYANLVVPALLDRSTLDARDRHFVTELVYGTTRMRRSCDWLIDRFVLDELDAPTRSLLRMGAYQLVHLRTPAHAAVSATVEAAPRKVRGLVNAVLRRVADASHEWPDEATRLSYPSWVIDRLTDDLGPENALAALEAMNHAASATERDDGYTQDLASQWVADAVEAAPADLVLDLCAAPGGKTTRMAHTGARVVAGDRRAGRVGLITSNADRLGVRDRVMAVAADGTRPPFATGSFDRILIDAPCSGLGALRRRPDARWRIEAADVDALARLQIELVEAAIPLLRPGALLAYSVCTLTLAESVAVDEHLAATHPELVALDPPTVAEQAWQPVGRGARVLPQTADTDGMYLLRLRLDPAARRAEER